MSGEHILALDDDAFAAIRRSAGTQFYPSLVNVFLRQLVAQSTGAKQTAIVPMLFDLNN